MAKQSGSKAGKGTTTRRDDNDAASMGTDSEVRAEPGVNSGPAVEDKQGARVYDRPEQADKGNQVSWPIIVVVVLLVALLLFWLL